MLLPNSNGLEQLASVTVAISGGNTGMSVPGAFGGISPNSFQGAAVNFAMTGPGVDFQIELNSGSFIQRSIQAIRIETTAGTIRTLDVAAATFSHPVGTSSRWSWPGSSPVWTATGTRRIWFVY